MGHVILIEIFIPPYLFATVLKYPSKQVFLDAFWKPVIFLPLPSFLTMQLEPPKQVLMARKVETKQAVLWMQKQRDAQVAACVDSTSRTVEVWMPWRQVLALSLYVEETVRCSRGMAGEWDPDTEMHRVRKVMAMVDYDGAAVGRAKGHTIQVVLAQASA